ncbi:MAG: prepilin-type N-terminal cleavage/methylation domain-containing protein [Opitutales bacterium]|nr:prepilin-type N-terminal cleavage/methylation domain-containing protein [Opitutales bacterium]
MKVKSNPPAFTLMELLLVIALIGILMAVLVPAYGIAGESAAREVSRAWFQKITLLYEDYYFQTGDYPSFHAAPACDLAGVRNEFIDLFGASLSEEDFRATDATGTRMPADGFSNPHTVVVLDLDGDGKIPLVDCSGLPQSFYPADRDFLYGRIVVYSANTDENPEWRWLCSWQ